MFVRRLAAMEGMLPAIVFCSSRRECEAVGEALT